MRQWDDNPDHMHIIRLGHLQFFFYRCQIKKMFTLNKYFVVCLVPTLRYSLLYYTFGHFQMKKK